MSGGSYNYFSYKLDEVISQINEEHYDSGPHLNFIEVLKKVSDVLHEIEWADSGDNSQEMAIKEINKFLRGIGKTDCKKCAILKNIRSLIK